MPTDTQIHTSPVALFLFAHQDDEFGVFQAILDELRRGRIVCCAYLTNGHYRGVTPERRNRESLKVLSQLGIAAEQVVFAGGELGIADGELPANLPRGGKWLQQWLQTFADIAKLYVPAWEGGHQDHDALHALVVTIASRKGLLDRVRQFSLYNGAGCPGRLYKVFQPLAQNGSIAEIPIPLRNRLRFLRYCMSYPSQAKAWLGLFPFVLLHYLIQGSQQLQPVALARLREPPHDGTPYYEKRGFFTWTEMQATLDSLAEIAPDYSTIR